MTAALIITAVVAILGALWLAHRWLDRGLAVDFDTREPTDTPIFDETLAVIRERAAMVASDDSWLRGAS